MSWQTRAASSALWFLTSLALSLAPFFGIAVLWLWRFQAWPGWNSLFGSGGLLLVAMAITAGGIVNGYRLSRTDDLPAIVQVFAAIGFVVLLLALVFVAMWYGALFTPGRAGASRVPTYNPSEVFRGSVIVFLVSSPISMLMAIVREAGDR